MHVWDVLGKRTANDDFVLVGGIKAPDLEMALILARETHFRHKEGVQYAARRRGDGRLHEGPYEGDILGGLTDRSYRRQDAYTGVGGRHRRLAEELAAQGLRIDRPRPPAGRRKTGTRLTPGDAEQADPSELSPEDLAAHGTAG